MRFVRDRRGNIGIIFGITSLLIFSAMGAGLDLSRAYLTRQQVSEVATLACQYASRPSVIDTSTSSYNGSNGNAAYRNQVAAFIGSTWQSQKVNFTQTNGAPFTNTQNGPADVTLTTAVPTTFMGLMKINSIAISVQTHCYDSPSSVPQRTPDSNSQLLMSESFESGGPPGGWQAYLPNGSVGFQSTPTQYTSATGYTGASGTKWNIVGYCLEQDSAGVIQPAVYDGNFSVELDCDNGSGSKGNSSITTSVYVPAGTYELRYAYSSRVAYPDYSPAYLCGSSASDLSWANATTTSWSGAMSSALRSNQINVYFDLNNGSTNVPPTHTTIDGTQQLSGSNLIDMCVYASSWVQRSVTLNVTTAGYYWLSFAADGANDSYGGQVDDIKFCRVSCSGSVKDNYPTSWASSAALFEDTFENPGYSGSPYNTSGNMNNSNGTSGSSSGWPNQSASGWATAPYNQMDIIRTNAAQGTQYIELDASNPQSSNRVVSRSFLLDPGYYRVDYRYVSDVQFTALPSAAFCTLAPNTSGASAYNVSGSQAGSLRFGGGVGSYANDTNIVAAFVSHGQLVSTPIGGGALNSQTSYLNPNGTTTTTPTVPPGYASLANYNTSQPNQMIDLCGYASAWQSRTAYIKIVKSGNYWLTFAALGTADNSGGAIDDVKISAAGSPYAGAPSSTVTTIPVPDPQPGSNIYYTGFSIAADTFAP